MVRCFSNAEELAVAAADVFLTAAEEAIARSGHFSVALSGGSTPRRLFEVLTQTRYRDRVEWDRVDFFWGDERSVPVTHPDSNFRMANQALLQQVDVVPENIHRMPADTEDLKRAAECYQAEIVATFGVDRDGLPPQFDLVLLGLGADGHTASLFPGTAALAERDAWVHANYVPQFDSHRLTLTVPMFNRARRTLFLIVGADKADALAQVLEGPSNPDECPAQLIRPEGELLFFADEAAAQNLSKAIKNGEVRK